MLIVIMMLIILLMMMIRDKISDIRAILSRLGNIVTKNDGDEIKKELYEIENKKNLSDEEKQKDS